LGEVRLLVVLNRAQDTAKFNHHNAAIIARMAEGVGSPAVTDPFHDSADRGA
jgi:hypothetical protein